MAAQIAAVLIFLVMFGLIITEKLENHITTLVCGLVTLLVVFGLCMRSPEAILETLNFKTMFMPSFWYEAGKATESSSAGINWETIIFIAGMMIMVEGMVQAGFFRWLCLAIAKLVNYKPMSIFIMFMILSAVLSMFIASITVILFLAAVTVELASLLKFNPVPMILAEVFCSNLGGAATMCGDPPNIIIGTSLGLTFGDFIANTGLIAGILLVFTVAYYAVFYRKDYSGAKVEKVDTTAFPKPSEVINSKFGFVASWVIFAGTVALLITHAQTGLTVAMIGVIVAVATLIAAGKSFLKVIKGIDYKTLLFFIGLFVVVGGLEQTGILSVIASFIAKICGGNTKLLIAIIIWVSGIASAFIDNVPFAATMVPVIQSLAATQGVDIKTLAWALSIGTDIGGSATPIGASANVVGTSVSAKNGHPISWKEYMKSAVPATIIVLAVSMFIVWMRYL